MVWRILNDQIDGVINRQMKETDKMKEVFDHLTPLPVGGDDIIKFPTSFRYYLVTDDNVYRDFVEERFP